MTHPRKFRFAVHTSAAPDGKTWMNEARRYEDLGFSTLLLRDHFDDQLGPIAAMTAAAAATTTLRVGCLVFDNDYRHPLVLAKELATIDVLSGGRVDVGIGAGWMAPDYEQAGIPFDPPGTRVSRMIEGVRIMKGLFADGPLDFAGEHYTITGHDGSAEAGPATAPADHDRCRRRADCCASPRARPTSSASTRSSAATRRGRTRTSPTPPRDATDRKVGWIRESAGERFDELELSIVAPFVVVTDDRVGLAESIAGRSPARPTRRGRKGQWRTRTRCCRVRTSCSGPSTRSSRRCRNDATAGSSPTTCATTTRWRRWPPSSPSSPAR